MRILVILYILIIGASCAPMLDKQRLNDWEVFKRVHQKQYATNEEESIRRNIWENNLIQIRQHNLEADLGVHTHRLGMNRFGDLTNEEFRTRMNGFKVPKTPTPNLDRHTFLAPSNVVLPEALDWRKEGYVTPVKDQQSCGSCWAFSATGALEGQHFAKTKNLVSLSEQNLVDCSDFTGDMGCFGGLMDHAFQYVKVNEGIDTEEGYPYKGHDSLCLFKIDKIGATSTGFVDIQAQNETALQYALATIGPISVAIDASHNSFQFYQSGVYQEPNCSSTELDHGVLAVGYGTSDSGDYYIIKNSWSTEWGDDGYILMSRNKQNQCGIATMASYPLV